MIANQSRDTSNLLLHLSLISGIGPAVVEKLVQAIGFERLHDIYVWRVQDFMRFQISAATSQQLVAGLADKKILEKELALIEKYTINWVTLYDSEYPELLKNTYLPPLVLYWQGQPLSNFFKTCSVIGSRKANNYGQYAIEAIVPVLVDAGWTIVSGGALGADSMAHHKTLEVGGLTIAVIGSGLLKPYPATNRLLFEKIIENNGAVVSSFPLTMAALPGNFPARNRIISGISRATVVIQAAESSGTRITALYALEQGRDVCAVPGPIDDALSAGCHKLISEGAALVTSGHDILVALGEKQFQPQPKRTVLPATTASIAPKDPLAALCVQPQSFDELLEQTGFEFYLLQDKLFSLQLEGIIKQNFMGLWQLSP